MPVERTASEVASFSELVVVSGMGSWVLIAGQIALDKSGRGVIGGGVGKEAERIFDRIDALLRGAGASLADVVRLTAYLTDLSRYSEFSAVRSRRFPDGPPASAAVGVADLLFGASIEIEGIAWVE